MITIKFVIALISITMINILKIKKINVYKFLSFAKTVLNAREAKDSQN